MENISFIIPVYNEGDILKQNLEKLNIHLKKILNKYEIICVNDGSIDNSQLILNDIDYISHIDLKINQGKGNAILTGINYAKYDLIFFMDADLSTDISEIEKFIDAKNYYDLVIGDRSDSKKISVKQPIYRIFIGKICNILFRIIFKIKLKDTQCGFKIFDRNLINTSEFSCTRYLFDLELVLNFYSKKLKIYPIKVNWKNDLNSKLNIFKDLPSFINEFYKLIIRY